MKLLTRSNLSSFTQKINCHHLHNWHPKLCRTNADTRYILPASLLP